MGGNPAGEFYKVGNRELLGALGEEGMLLAAEVAKDRFERVANHLAALVERRLDNLDKELLVAVEALDTITLEAYNGTLDLGGWVEDLLTDGKEVLYIVPRLKQYAKYAILLRAGGLGESYRHLLLYHTHTLGDKIAVLQYLEEDLRRDIVGEVTDDLNALRKQLLEVHLQKVAFHKAGRELGVVAVEILNRFAINLGTIGDNILPLE